MRRSGLLMLCCATLLVSGAAAGAAHDAGHATAPKAMAAAKARPGLATGAAISPQGQLWIAGVDEARRLFVQSSPDFGATWRPRQVLDTAGDPVSADGESFPKIAFGAGDTVVVAYTKPLAKPYTGDIRMLRSGDGGRTFSSPFTVHDDRQAITHRFESIAFDRKGTLYVTWVDKRDAEAARERAGGKRAAYDGAAIYGKVSEDGARSFGPDLKLADSSCECCRIALVEAPGAGMVALWRHVFAGSIRDHAFAPLSDLGRARAPVRATEDGWVLAACPHHGPGLANAAQGGFHAVWFGVRGEKPGVRYGRLSANGAPAGPVRELPDERAEHADLAASGKSVAIVWRSFDGERTRLRAWVSADGGETFVLRELAATAEDNDHPRLVSRGGDAWVVWRKERSTDVYRIAY